MNFGFRTDKGGKMVDIEFGHGTAEEKMELMKEVEEYNKNVNIGDVERQLGIKVNGAFFNMNGTELTWGDFIRKIESVGLEYGGETQRVDEDGKIYKVENIDKWVTGNIVK